MAVEVREVVSRRNLKRFIQFSYKFKDNGISFTLYVINRMKNLDSGTCSVFEHIGTRTLAGVQKRRDSRKFVKGTRRNYIQRQYS